jgi:WS/DGAT/MGAT family acyltransferase
MSGRLDGFMRESDAFSWYMESDPALRATIVVVAWFDQPPDWGTLAHRLERATRLVPIFRQRPVEPPGRMATPRWTLDPDFDLSRHLRRVGSPPPHTSDTVLEMARWAAMSGFDTAHPVWEFTLVESLTGGGAALIMKLHHSLTDGLGGMQLLLALFDIDADPPVQGAIPEPPVEHMEGTAELLTASALHEGRKILALAQRQASAVLPALWRAGRHPLRQTRDVVEMIRSVGRTVAPVSSTLSPIMKGRSLGRQLAMLEVGLDDLKQASAVAGGSVNDGFMAAVTGGLRRYHEHHGRPVDELRVTLPISIRTAEDPAAGNRLTLERFTVPVGLADPAARIQAIGKRCREARAERSVPHSNAIAGVLNLLPQGAVGSMLKHVDFLASNVPGFAFPVYLAGSRVTTYVPFSPTIGAAVNVTLLSYDGRCGVGVTVDTAAVPDIEVFMGCLAQGFNEVLDLAQTRLHPDESSKRLIETS